MTLCTRNATQTRSLRESLSPCQNSMLSLIFEREEACEENDTEATQKFVEWLGPGVTRNDENDIETICGNMETLGVDMGDKLLYLQGHTSPYAPRAPPDPETALINLRGHTSKAIFHIAVEITRVLRDAGIGLSPTALHGRMESGLLDVDIQAALNALIQVGAMRDVSTEQGHVILSTRLITPETVPQWLIDVEDEAYMNVY
jgi:hypothetical protein